ncbi:hypothetical protein WDU94_014143 [Cyamophila willieti]
MPNQQADVDPSSRPASSQSNNEEEEDQSPLAEEIEEKSPAAPKLNGEVKNSNNSGKKNMANESVLVPPMNETQDDSELEDEEVDER